MDCTYYAKVPLTGTTFSSLFSFRAFQPTEKKKKLQERKELHLLCFIFLGAAL